MPTYVGTNGDDFPGNDQINNVLYGLDGNDNLDTMILGTAYVYGGQGNDDLNKVDNMFGIAVISGDAGNDTIDGGSQNDELYGGNDRDHITGMDGNDIIEGGNGVDTLFGEGGSDTIYGGGSTDRVDGSDGNDNLYGGAGNDTTIVITTGAGLSFSAAGGLYGGGGNDFLSGGQGIDYLDGGTENDILFGGDGDDTLLGRSGNDQLEGGSGADQLEGAQGLDELDGDAGDDVINGGLGRDQLRGGGQDDTFVFDVSPTSANRDTIADFYALDDVIHLDNAIFTTLVLGTLAASRFKIGAVATDANDRIIYNDATGAVFYDSNGNAAGGSLQIATLQSKPTISNVDFVVV